MSHCDHLKLHHVPRLSDASNILKDTGRQSINTCTVNGTSSISLYTDCTEFFLFAGEQLTELLVSPIYISGQRFGPPIPAGTALDSLLCCTWIRREVLTDEGFLANME